MSSSDEGIVRRPGRNSGAGQPASPSGSEQSNPATARNGSPVGADPDILNDDDDADLFGSDGSEGGFGNDNEYCPLFIFPYDRDINLLLVNHNVTLMMKS